MPRHNPPNRTYDGDATDSSRPRPHAGCSDEPFIVGIGASADGLRALKAFFEALPDDPEMAFIVAQHLAPDHESGLGDILQNSTSMPVQDTGEGASLRPGCVYVLPADKQVSLAGGELRLEEKPALEGSRHTIDFLFRSLAEECGERAVGVLLSGAGTDGTTGLRLIHEHGGITFAQSPADAGYDSMPRSAINEGVVDFVLPAAELAGRVAELPDRHRELDPLDSPDELADEKREALDRIMAMVGARTGTDLSHYKRPTLLRRIGRRMQVCQTHTIQAYEKHLDEHPDEIDELFDELLIGVTSFFRDPEVWETINEEVIPELFADKSGGDEVRVWVPGCSTGEEAYTVAILLTRYAESLDRQPPEIKVFATDLDGDAIDTARVGAYPPAIASDVPDHLLHRYFRVEDDRYYVAKAVRSRVMFAVQNVLIDPPFSNLDLVSCRNLLIYLEPEAQQRLLELLNYALRPDGILVLGESETPARHSEMFDEHPAGHHIYRTSDQEENHARARPAFGFDPSRREPEAFEPREREQRRDKGRDVAERHRQALLDRHAPPSIVIDDDYQILHVVGDVRSYLSVRPGELTGDILDMLADPVRPHVRTMLFEAFQSDGEPVRRRLDVDDEPLEIRATRLDPDLVELTFQSDVFTTGVAGAEIPDEDRDVVECLERELDATRDQLQSTVDEYESTNEELRASNEEMMSMNEELQSTTEELQTSKEELQAMNEELTTMNDELNDKIEKLDAANSDLRNLMRSTDIGTVFLDRDLRVKRFTDPVTEYINLIPTDEGRPFEHLSGSLDIDELTDDARRVMAKPTSIEREIEAGEGRHLLVRILPYLNLDDQIEGSVLTFIDITDRKEIERDLARSEEKFRNAFHSVFAQAADAMFVYPLRDGVPGRFSEYNEAMAEQVGVSMDQLGEMTVHDILDGPNFDLEVHLRQLREHGETTSEARLEPVEDGDPTPVRLTARLVEFGDAQFVVALARDISERKRHQKTIVDKRQVEELADLRSMYLSTLSHDVRTPLSVIVTMAEALRRQLDDADVEMVERIEQSTEQLRKILDSILRMAQLDAQEAIAEPERIELLGHVEEIVDLHEPFAENKGLDFRFEAPESPIDVEIDPRFLAQLLNNLLDNAVKYTHDGDVTVRVEAGDDQVRIHVADTGPGIPEEEREHIFERARTGSQETDEHYSQGLGLAITKKLTEAMGGTVSVESTEGEGTTFTVEFPRDSSVDTDES